MSVSYRQTFKLDRMDNQAFNHSKVKGNLVKNLKQNEKIKP
jgi:hypothetical protein